MNKLKIALIFCLVVIITAGLFNAYRKVSQSEIAQSQAIKNAESALQDAARLSRLADEQTRTIRGLRDALATRLPRVEPAPSPVGITTTYVPLDLPKIQTQDKDDLIKTIQDQDYLIYQLNQRDVTRLAEIDKLHLAVNEYSRAYGESRKEVDRLKNKLKWDGWLKFGAGCVAGRLTIRF